MSTKVFPSCPIRTTLELLGGKWRLLLIDALREGPLRFGEIKAQLPSLSEKVLAQELAIMAENHLIVRRQYEEHPPRVEYALTDWGREALPLLGAMREFGLAYQSDLFQRDEAQKRP